MLKQIGAILGDQQPNQASTPVRRQSYAARGSDGFWRKITRQEAAKIRLAAERYELSTRQRGARYGALGSVALEVINYLTRLVDFRTGRLEPSLDFLQMKLKRTRAAIVRALKALRSHGFVDWLRRYIPTGNEGRGPQVKQTSNAYRLLLPKNALQCLGHFGVPFPLPEDIVHSRDVQAIEIRAQLSALSIDDQMAFKFGATDPIGLALARLKKAMGSVSSPTILNPNLDSKLTVMPGTTMLEM